MSPETIKHLEFVQAVITRMNTNSFQIKSWSITINSALLAIFSSTKSPYFILAAIFPTTIFWILDSYYLSQERKFRGIYNDVAGLTENPITTKLFEMRPNLYVGGRYKYFSSFLSNTIIKLYLSLNSALVLLFIYFIKFPIKGV